MIYFAFPRNITSDRAGYEFLGKISIETFNLTKKQIFFDFSETQRFEVNLCSPVAALINDLRERNNEVILYGFEYGIEKVLKQNGFYQLVNDNYKAEDIHYSTIIDFRRFRTDETLIFQEYVNKQLLEYSDFPKLSDLLKKHINKSILEIFNNAHIHGGCDYVFTCGEYFPKDKRLKFTISDLGLTIRKNVNLYFNSGSAIDGKDALSWAVQEGNTTRTGSIPGGLGLSLIRDFIKKMKALYRLFLQMDIGKKKMVLFWLLI